MKKQNFGLLSPLEKLKKIAQVTGLSRTALAERLHVSYKTVQRWLDQGIVPQAAHVFAIDEVYKAVVDLRETISHLKKEYPDPIKRLTADPKVLESLYLQMTYHSNAIEGSRMTEAQTQTAFSGGKVKGREFYEVLESVNHKNALHFLFEKLREGAPLSLELLLRLHGLVLYDFNDKLPGKFRTGFVNLTNTEKKLPSFQEVPLLIGKWILQNNQKMADPLGTIARAHYDFEAIHPFFDGNGRVGRLLAMFQLLQRGYPPAIIRIEDRYQYYYALGRGDEGDMKYIEQMIAESVLRGYEMIYSSKASAKL